MEVLRLMGGFVRANIIPFSPSASDVTVYADNDTSRRDIQTAENFMLGFCPGCNLTVHADPAMTTWLFNQGAKSPQPGCTLPTEQQVLARIGGSIDDVVQQNRDLVMSLSTAIDCCNASVCESAQRGASPPSSSPPPRPGSSECTLMDLPSTFNPAAFWSLFSGPLATSSTLAELLCLAYQNNMDISGVAPGLDAYQLSRLMRAHAINLAITDSNLVTAQAFGSQLLAHIAATVRQLTSGSGGGGGGGGDDNTNNSDDDGGRLKSFAALRSEVPLLSKPSDRVVYYAGHDINTYFLRVMLGLSWETASYNPNMAPPGSLLGFYLLQEEEEEEEEEANDDSIKPDDQKPWYVKIYFHTQSMDQMRFLATLNATHPPGSAFAVLPDCMSGPDLSCPVEDFERLVWKRLRTECLR
eukprot:g5095.t1